MNNDHQSNNPTREPKYGKTNFMVDLLNTLDGFIISKTSQKTSIQCQQSRSKNQHVREKSKI